MMAPAVTCAVIVTVGPLFCACVIVNAELRVDAGDTVTGELTVKVASPLVSAIVTVPAGIDRFPYESVRSIFAVMLALLPM